MRFSTSTPFLLLVAFLLEARSFSPPVGFFRDRCTGTIVWGDTNAAPADVPPNLVNKDAFLGAVDALKVQITKETGEEFPSEDTVEGKPLLYVLGRLQLALPFAPTPPNLALTDSTGMTLVAAVGESSRDSGIQPFDTITSIGANGGAYRQSTIDMSLSETTATLTQAANHAVENGLFEIEVEVNRLMKGYYQ